MIELQRSLSQSRSESIPWPQAWDDAVEAATRSLTASRRAEVVGALRHTRPCLRLAYLNGPRDECGDGC
jgi:hypothetical protein